jgi:hypothetical protein
MEHNVIYRITQRLFNKLLNIILVLDTWSLY